MGTFKFGSGASKGLLLILLAMAAALLLWNSSEGPSVAQAIEAGGIGAEEVYKEAGPSVFYLKVFRKDGTLKTVGTGFLIGGGKALTAAHVVADGAKLEATFDDGAVIAGITVSAVDEDKDLAVLSLRAGQRRGLAVESGVVAYGGTVMAIGYPLRDGKIISEGIVNSPSAPVNGQNRLLVSSQVSGGMSGGPLLNENGRVIGLISGSFRTMAGIHIGVSAEDIAQLLQAIE
ncbi:S1 family peptidase [Paenibacillus sp. CAU 1782]